MKNRRKNETLTKDYSHIKCQRYNQNGHYSRCQMLGNTNDQNDKSQKLKGENDQKQATVTKGDKKWLHTPQEVECVIHEIAWIAGKKSLLDEYDILCDHKCTQL